MNVLKIAVFATMLLAPMANAEPECKGGGADPSTFCAPGLEWDSEIPQCENGGSSDGGAPGAVRLEGSKRCRGERGEAGSGLHAYVQDRTGTCH